MALQGNQGQEALRAQKRRTKTPSHIVDEAVRRYRAGESPRAIAADLGVSRHHVSNWVLYRGTPRHRKNNAPRLITAQEWNEIVIPMWRSYYSCRAIADKIGVSVAVIRYHSHIRGLYAAHPRDGGVSLGITALARQSTLKAEKARQIAADEGPEAARKFIDAAQDNIRNSGKHARAMSATLARKTVARAEADGTLAAMTRNRQMQWLRNVAGLSFKEIGQRYEVSRARAHAIVATLDRKDKKQ